MLIVGGGGERIEAGLVVDAAGPRPGGLTGEPAADRPFPPPRACKLPARRFDLPVAIGLPLPDGRRDRGVFSRKGARRPEQSSAPAATAGAHRAAGLKELDSSRPAWSRAVPGGGGTSGAEIAWAAREETAMTLADVVFRRTRLGLAADCPGPTLQAAAGLMAEVCGWSDRRRALEMAGVGAELERLARRTRAAPAPRAAVPAASLDAF